MNRRVLPIGRTKLHPSHVYLIGINRQTSIRSNRDMRGTGPAPDALQHRIAMGLAAHSGVERQVRCWYRFLLSYPYLEQLIEEGAVKHHGLA